MGSGTPSKGGSSGGPGGLGAGQGSNESDKAVISVGWAIYDYLGTLKETIDDRVKKACDNLMNEEIKKDQKEKKLRAEREAQAQKQ